MDADQWEIGDAPHEAPDAAPPTELARQIEMARAKIVRVRGLNMFEEIDALRKRQTAALCRKMDIARARRFRLAAATHRMQRRALL